MYYAQAMNHRLFAAGDPEANLWADRAEAAFRRDAALCREYNKDMSGGKWDGMMIQKHIGYFMWNDNFPADTMPVVYRFENPGTMTGGYVFRADGAAVVMDAGHYYSAEGSSEASWTLIPFMGRTRSGMSLQPYNVPVGGASISYRFALPQGVSKVSVHVVTASTLAFDRKEGHRYTVALDGGTPVEVNFNGELNEEPQNVYRIMYPTVASRVIEKTLDLDVPASGMQTLTICPLDPGVVLEKIVVDWGGYRPGYLFGEESPVSRQ